MAWERNMSQEEDDKIAQLKKAIRAAESQHSYYRTRYGCFGGLREEPYRRLAIIYRKRGDYDAAIKVLERFFNKITTEDGQVHTSTKAQEQLVVRMKKARQLSKQKPDGICDGCGNSPRQVAQIESGQWVCRSCLREIRGPQRPKSLATPEQIAHLREQGFNVPDDLPKLEYRRLAEIIVLRGRGVPFNMAATLEELEAIDRRTYVNHRSTNLAGVSHINGDGTNRQRIIARCSAGEVLVLTHEVDNPADPNAIAVFRQNGEQLGYLNREEAEDVLRHSRDGWQYVAVISKILDDGVRGHWRGVGLSLVYAHPTVDMTIVQKHVADLSTKYWNGEWA